MGKEAFTLMAERIEFQEKRLVGRELLTPLDLFRAAEQSVATLNSGATQSGTLAGSGGGIIFQVSSPVKARLLGLDMFNQEVGWIEVEFRDGHFGGSRVAGPYKLDGRIGVNIPYWELQGKVFTSGIYGVVLSGWTALPLSNGIKVNCAMILEPRDIYGT